MPAAPWLLEVVHDLRALEFFEDRGRTDEDVAAELADDYEAAWNEPPDQSKPLIELELVHFDESRVWWEDTEADVADGNRVYLEAIAALSRISRGVFRPTGVTETWDGPTGPLHIVFHLDGLRRVIRPRYLNDYLDIEGLIDAIDAFMQTDAPRFEIYAPFDQTAFVVCVTDIERRRLEERGWSFRRGS
jgi:hypothetical protein